MTTISSRRPGIAASVLPCMGVSVRMEVAVVSPTLEDMVVSGDGWYRARRVSFWLEIAQSEFPRTLRQKHFLAFFGNETEFF